MNLVMELLSSWKEAANRRRHVTLYGWQDRWPKVREQNVGAILQLAARHQRPDR